MAVVGLEETLYHVTEGVGVVEVCATVYEPIIDCPIAFPFNISISTGGKITYHTCNYQYSELIISIQSQKLKSIWKVHNPLVMYVAKNTRKSVTFCDCVCRYVTEM